MSSYSDFLEEQLQDPAVKAEYDGWNLNSLPHKQR